MTFASIRQFVVRKWYLVALLVVLGVTLILRLITPSLLSKQSSLYSFKSIDPSQKTSKETVLNLLGQPENVIQDNNSETYQYASPYKTAPQEVVLQNGVVIATRERILASDSDKYKDLLSKLGTEDFVTQVPGLDDIFPLHVYLSKGMAVAFNNDVIFELWKFNPMSESDFRATIGKQTQDNFTHSEPPIVPYQDPKSK